MQSWHADATRNVVEIIWRYVIIGKSIWRSCFTSNIHFSITFAIHVDTMFLSAFHFGIVHMLDKGKRTIISSGRQ